MAIKVNVKSDDFLVKIVPFGDCNADGSYYLWPKSNGITPKFGMTVKDTFGNCCFIVGIVRIRLQPPTQDYELKYGEYYEKLVVDGVYQND